MSGEMTPRARTLGDLRRMFERFDTAANNVGAPGSAVRKRYAEEAEVLKEAIHFLGLDGHLEKNKALQRTADPDANALIEAMLPQLLLVLIRRAGGDVRVPVDEIDATGGLVMGMVVEGNAFRFVVRRKSA